MNLAPEPGTRLGQVYAYRTVGSTMEIAHALAAQGAPHGTLVWAATQEQGRGRLRRVWVSPDGGAYCSIILRPDRPAAEIPQLALVTGLAVAETIQELTGLLPAIRWPNDVLLSGRKVAGILVEGRDTGVVVGIGINVATNPALLPETAASLAELAPQALTPDAPVRVTARLYHRFQTWYDRWINDGFAAIRAALQPRMGHFGELVQLTAGNRRLEGQAVDVDEAGRLVVRLDSGVLQAFEMGEVTLLR